jgi:3-oxoacyl-[acyl-carrier-protein] synthase-3
MKIVSVASAIPQTFVSNDAVEARLGLEPGWIENRTGILRRPTASPAEATSDFAVRAAARALERSRLEINDIGLLLLATSTPDHLLPPTAPLVAHRVGLKRAGAIDLTGACAGFLYALVLANTWGQSMQKAVMVVGANVLTRRINERDPATVPLFSDGAGAVVLVPSEPSHILGAFVGADGSHYDAMGITAGGTREPLTTAGLKEGRHLMTIRHGSAIFKQAVHAMTHAGKEAMKVAGLEPAEIDCWIPHQANARMTSSAGSLLGIPPERTISVVEQYGNSSAATIPIALAHGIESGCIQNGNLLLLTAAGAGMVSAGMVLRW